MTINTVTVPRKDYWGLVSSIYITMLSMGILENSKSVGFAVIKTHFNTSYESYGVFTTCLNFSYIMALIVASFCLEVIHYKWIYSIGYIVAIVPCFMTQFAYSFFGTGVCMFIAWMSVGLFSIVGNATATKVFHEHRGTMMSLMHFCYGIGAMIGPNISRLALKYLKNSFYSIYLCLGTSLIILFIIFEFSPFHLPVSESKSSSSQMTVWKALCVPSVWLCAITMGMIQTVENSCANWASLYLVDVLDYNVDVDVPNYTTAVYAIFTISRLISGPMIDKVGYYCYIYICLAACFVILGVGFLMGRYGIYMFELAGFFYSATWPVFICVLMDYYKEDAALLSSVVIMIEGIVILPLGSIQGWMNENFGPTWALRSSLFFCVIGAILLRCVYCSHKRKERIELKKQEIVDMKDIEMHEKKSEKNNDSERPVIPSSPVIIKN